MLLKIAKTGMVFTAVSLAFLGSYSELSHRASHQGEIADIVTSSIDIQSRLYDSGARTPGASLANSPAYREADIEARTRARGDVVSVSPDDKGLKKAIAQARASLPRFLRMFEHPDPNLVYLVKYPVTENGVTENMWMRLETIRGDTFSGILSSEPVEIASIKLGDPVATSRDKIYDWMAQGDDAIYGGYTMRHFLGTLPKDQAAAIRSILRD